VGAASRSCVTWPDAAAPESTYYADAFVLQGAIWSAQAASGLDHGDSPDSLPPNTSRIPSYHPGPFTNMKHK
jgi:hypothetical protein